MSKPTPEGFQDQSPKLVTSTGWIKQCAANGSGKALPTLAKAMVALRLDPVLRDAFAFDEMLQTAVLTKPLNPSPSPDDLAAFVAHPVTDLDVTELALFIETQKIGTADTRRITAAMTNLGWKREREVRATAFYPSLKAKMFLVPLPRIISPTMNHASRNAKLTAK